MERRRLTILAVTEYSTYYDVNVIGGMIMVPCIAAPSDLAKNYSNYVVVEYETKSKFLGILEMHSTTYSIEPKGD